MKNFLLGVLVASAIWGALVWLQASGVMNLLGDEVEPRPVVVDAGIDPDARSEDKPEKKKRRGKGRRRGGKSTPGYETGVGSSGDDLTETGSRDMDLGGAGGERQLTGAQIDRGIDQVFSGIQRCLVLVPPGAPATGKVVVGMKIAGGGKVTAVNLSGPNDIIKGECGACIRRAVRSIDYPAFDGPEMTVRYPIIFE